MIASSRKSPVGAHYGLADWLLQRITAVVMLVYTLLALAILLWHGGIDHERFVSLFQSQILRILTFLFMVSLAYHAWVGMRNMAMDYVKPIAIRLSLQSAIVAALIAYLGWTIGVLWG
ncbi:MAG TPA: succinate dehydrogenase, hydrophobic membrane anchor protein [Casimicrobiaceae bacterium]|nr:succinate dehydrogenase, hydrophobic membrane anchor protein [Casimicrobiaceae bacterium]